MLTQFISLDRNINTPPSKSIDQSALLHNFVVQDINECQNSPCLHGNCTDHANMYTCDCFLGYTGSNCETGNIKDTFLQDLY